MLPRRYGLFVLVIAFLSACATGGKEAREEKALEELRAMINRAHDQALVAEGAPTLAEEMMRLSFMVEFGKERCGGSTSPDQARRCDELFKREFVSRLTSRYFAADQSAITQRCHAEPAACRDPKILEGWMRASHNERIEASRREKLPKLEDWRRGLISNEDLRASLHLSVK